MHSLNPFRWEVWPGSSREATSNDARRYPYAHKCSLNTHTHSLLISHVIHKNKNEYKLMKCIKGTRCELRTVNCELELWPGTCDLWQGRWVPALVSAHSSGRSRQPPPTPSPATAHLQNTRHSHHYHNLNTFRASFKIFMRAKDFQVFARVCALWRCAREGERKSECVFVLWQGSLIIMTVCACVYSGRPLEGDPKAKAQWLNRGIWCRYDSEQSEMRVLKICKSNEF